VDEQSSLQLNVGQVAERVGAPVRTVRSWSDEGADRLATVADARVERYRMQLGVLAAGRPRSVGTGRELVDAGAPRVSSRPGVPAGAAASGGPAPLTSQAGGPRRRR
jgi:hypothetical protein